nr:hypothetical protein [Tanacetum cinerariifolium]
MVKLQYPFRKVRMRFETTERYGWMNEAEEALQRIKKKLNKLQTLAVPKQGEILMLCLRQKDKTISSVLLATFNQNKKLQAKSTPTPRAWRLYLGKEIIEEGSGVGIILVSLEKRMHSYVIHLKFNASDHAIDCEALLAGLAASVSKGIETRPSMEETSSIKKGKAASNVPVAKPNSKWEASGSN